MKRLLSCAAVFILLAVGTMRAFPQRSLDLTTVGASVMKAVQAKKADWKYEAVSPIEGSADVVLQQWTLDSQTIRIAIISHRSQADAANIIGALTPNRRELLEPEGLGDEAVSWGKNTISFRRENLTFDISAVTTNPTLDLTESSNRQVDEQKLCEEFARLVADATNEKN